MGWTIDTEAGMIPLPERKLQEMNQLIAIPAMQRCIGQKELERLAGKLLSVHLVVPGVIAHLYHIQRAMTQGGEDRAWLLPYFHQ